MNRTLQVFILPLRVLWRMADILASLLLRALVLVCLPAARLAFSTSRRQPRRMSVLLNNFDLDLVLAHNTRAFAALQYTHPHIPRTLSLHVGPWRRRTVRIARTVACVCVPVPAMSLLKHCLPSLHRALAAACGLAATVRFIRRANPLLVDCFHPNDLVWQAVLVHWICRTRLIGQVYGNDDLRQNVTHVPSFFPYALPGRLGEALGILADKVVKLAFFRSCSIVVCYNTDNAKHAICNGAAPEKILQLRIKIDRSMLDSPLRPRNELEGFPQQGRVLGHWSRLEVTKRSLEGFVQACEAIVDRPDVSLVVIGDGGQLGAMKRHAAERGLEDRVYFPGMRSLSYIRSALAHMDAAYFPLGGNTLVEAALNKVPVAVWDLEWHSEFIRPGETGYLATYGEPDGLARAIGQALDNPAEARALAERCKALAEAMFDETRIDELASRFFEQALARMA